jgi:rhodanese-related sulfurtransferase
MSGVWIVVALVALYVVVTFIRRRATSGGINNAQSLRTVIASEEPYTLIDVRTPDEYRSGHIPTAVNIPHDRIGKKPPRAQKDSLVIVYCHSGSRSMVARSQLVRMGYTRVANFGRVGKWDTTLVDGGKPGVLEVSQ